MRSGLWLVILGTGLILLGYIKMLKIDPDMPFEEVVKSVKIWNASVFLGAGLILYFFFKRRY